MIGDFVYLTKYFSVVKETSEGFKACCPMCEDKEFKLSVNTEKGVMCCFHAHCPWFYEKGGATARRLEAFFSKHGIPYRIPENLKRTPVGDVALPDDFEILDELPDRLSDDLYTYLQNRGLHRKIIRAAQVGYCQKGKYWGYFIFPVPDEEGSVQYFQARRFKNREPKFRNPASTKKTELLYRLGTAAKPRRIVLVESIINVMTITSLKNQRDLVLGIFGKTISEIQKDYVLQYQKWLRELIVALDGPQERDNTKHAAVQIAKAFEGAVPAVKIAQFPEGEDVNSVGREKSWDIIERAKTFQRNKNEAEFLYGPW